MSIFQTSFVGSWVAPGRTARPRRAMDRETTPGRCGNLDYCTIGMQRVRVDVPISQAFVCPECSSPLRPPGDLFGAARPRWLPVARVGVLLAAMAGSLGVGYAVGRAQSAVHAAVRDAAVQAGSRLDAAGRAFGLAQPAPAAAEATRSQAPTPAPMFVAERAFPSRAAPVDLSNPPERLAREARFGQVTIDCLLASALTHPACHVVNIRGADAFSANAIAWLQGEAVQYAPSTRGGTPTLLDHRWRVVFQDFSGKQPAEVP